MESPVFGKQDEQTVPPLDINYGDISDSIKIILLSFFYNKKQSAF